MGKLLKLKQSRALIIQISQCLASGISLNKALCLIRDHETKNEQKKILNTSISDLNKGYSFISCLRPILPNDFYLSQLSTNHNPDIRLLLPHLIHYFDVKISQIEMIKKEMKYPIFLCGLSICLIILFLSFLAPQYSELFINLQIPLPPLFKAVDRLNQIIANFYLSTNVVLLLIAAPILIFCLFKKTLLQIKKQYSNNPSDILWIFGIFLKGNYSIQEILEMINFSGRSENTIFSCFKKKFQTTGLFSKSFCRYFTIPSIDQTLLKNSEQSGNLTQTVLDISKSLSETHHLKKMNLLKVIPSACLLFVSLLIFLFMSSTFLPLLEGLGNLNF
ncbi:hypothetical protein HOH45_00125 [bacterium]|jgi:type II secretory pathway component PulF|nr:hypothetical protein [bacterium]